MRRRLAPRAAFWAVLFAAGLLTLAAPARAVCSGESLEREFSEADVVVRATVVAETRVHDDEPSAALRRQWGDSFPVMLHRLRVIERFKGAPGPTINLFQEVNSGRFEIDWDKQYLLFLSYIRPYRGRGTAARGAMHVRYACGQSKPWSEVPAAVRARLRRMARSG